MISIYSSPLKTRHIALNFNLQYITIIFSHIDDIIVPAQMALQVATSDVAFESVSRRLFLS